MRDGKHLGIHLARDGVRVAISRHVGEQRQADSLVVDGDYGSMPYAVYSAPDGGRFAGRVALEHAAAEPRDVATDFLDEIHDGGSRRFAACGETIAAEELLTEVLVSVGQAAEGEAARGAASVTIATPTGWSDDAIAVALCAAHAAGVSPCHAIPESIAAVYALHGEIAPEDARWLVVIESGGLAMATVERSRGMFRERLARYEPSLLAPDVAERRTMYRHVAVDAQALLAQDGITAEELISVVVLAEEASAQALREVFGEQGWQVESRFVVDTTGSLAARGAALWPATEDAIRAWYADNGVLDLGDTAPSHKLGEVVTSGRDTQSRSYTPMADMGERAVEHSPAARSHTLSAEPNRRGVRWLFVLAASLLATIGLAAYLMPHGREPLPAQPVQPGVAARPDSLITTIRDSVRRIVADLAGIQPLVGRVPGVPTDVEEQRFILGARTRKVMRLRTSASERRVSEYYFTAAGQLIFVTESVRALAHARDTSASLRQERYYFADGRLQRWINARGAIVPDTMQAFAQAEQRLLHTADQESVTTSR